MDKQFELRVGPGDADLKGCDNTVIQAAVDRLAALGGGAVRLLPGRYVMHDSLHLRSGVRVIGEGEDTVLWKAPCVSSPLLYYLGYGHYDVSVAEPEKFRPGMGVHITDDRAGGFYDTVATVVGVRGNELLLSRMLNHDYGEAFRGRAASLYPIVSGYHLRDAAVENLTIDGNAAENEALNGCRGGGVFLLQAHDVRLSHVTVRDYHGEGISFQQCVRTVIEDCACVGNRGNGLHPGSGSVGTVMRRAVCRNNGADGLFYCLRVSYTLCEDCVFEENARDGVSIGHRDDDTLLRRNKIGKNGRHGVYLRQDASKQSGLRNILTANRFYRNAGREIYLDAAAGEFIVAENRFETGQNGAQAAVYAAKQPDSLYVYGNDCGAAEPLEAAAEFSAGIYRQRPAVWPAVGPDAAPADAARHLGRPGVDF